MAVRYEWDVETVADGDSEEFEDGEVVEHNHFDTFREAKAFAASKPDPGRRFEVVLVRDDDELRSWAYLLDGLLPDFFMDADGRERTRVPKRFVAEVAKAKGE